MILGLEVAGDKHHLIKVSAALFCTKLRDWGGVNEDIVEINSCGVWHSEYAGCKVSNSSKHIPSDQMSMQGSNIPSNLSGDVYWFILIDEDGIFLQLSHVNGKRSFSDPLDVLIKILWRFIDPWAIWSVWSACTASDKSLNHLIKVRWGGVDPIEWI